MFHNVWVGCATVNDRKSVSWRLGGEGMYVCMYMENKTCLFLRSTFFFISFPYVRGNWQVQGDFSPTVSQSLEGDLVLVSRCYPWVYP